MPKWAQQIGNSVVGGIGNSIMGGNQRPYQPSSNHNPYLDQYSYTDSQRQADYAAIWMKEQQERLAVHAAARAKEIAKAQYREQVLNQSTQILGYMLQAGEAQKQDKKELATVAMETAEALMALLGINKPED